MSIEIIGIDHIYIAVSDLNRSERFYDRMMTILGFRKNNFVNEGDKQVVVQNVPLPTSTFTITTATLVLFFGPLTTRSPSTILWLRACTTSVSAQRIPQPWMPSRRG